MYMYTGMTVPAACTDVDMAMLPELWLGVWVRPPWPGACAAAPTLAPGPWEVALAQRRRAWSATEDIQPILK